MITTHMYKGNYGEAEVKVIDKNFREYEYQNGRKRKVSRVIFIGDQGQEYQVFSDLLTPLS